MTLANLELAQFKRANFKNAIMREMCKSLPLPFIGVEMAAEDSLFFNDRSIVIVGSTKFDGVASIENTDWTDTDLRKDQRKYLCQHPTARGTNPTTGVDTRESLLCE